MNPHLVESITGALSVILSLEKWGAKVLEVAKLHGMAPWIEIGQLEKPRK